MVNYRLGVGNTQEECVIITEREATNEFASSPNSIESS